MKPAHFLTAICGLFIVACSNLSGQDVSAANEQELAHRPSKFDLEDKTYYVPIAPVEDKGGLTIAGDNDSESIRKLTSINEIPISQIEELMRPGNKDERSAKSGFLGREENLVELLVADNDLVHSHGLTHRDLAIPLLQLFGKARQNRIESPPGTSRYISEFAHAGTNWSVSILVTNGFQYSPFNDGTRASADFVITNLDNGKSLRVAELVPIMIERYGFYEGHGTVYRVSPEKIIELLGIGNGGSGAEKELDK